MLTDLTDICVSVVLKLDFDNLNLIKNLISNPQIIIEGYEKKTNNNNYHYIVNSEDDLEECEEYQQYFLNLLDKVSIATTSENFNSLLIENGVKHLIFQFHYKIYFAVQYEGETDFSQLYNGEQSVDRAIERMKSAKELFLSLGVPDDKITMGSIAM